MSIAKLCTREVIGVRSDASLREAATLMCEQHVGSLVVTSDDQPPKVVGILTDRDLALEVLGRDDTARELRAGDLAKSPPVAVRDTASLQEAVEAMGQAGVRRLLVVEEDGGVVGLISAEDLMAAISAELAGLSRALRSGIEREQSERSVIAKPPAMRPVFPAFGTVAMQ